MTVRNVIGIERTAMVFKEPHNHAEAIRIEQRADALILAAHALDNCKIEPDTSAKLRPIAEQMMDAYHRASFT